MRGRISGASIVALVLVAFWAPTSASAADPAPRHDRPVPELTFVGRDAMWRALERGDLGEAAYALARARALFDPPASERWGASVRVDPHLATMVLRDLAVRVRLLSARDRDLALRILARPTDGADDPAGLGYTTDEVETTCSTQLCVHWVTTTADAPPLADGNGDGVPDQVEATIDAFETAWDAEVVDAGYRRPKSDATSANHGPDGRLDVYLAEIGASLGVYGLTITDDPNVSDRDYPYWDASAYLVMDDDYAEFAPTAPLDAMRVTAAHEFFHAVQYAYDVAEDVALMEQTATWMEDEVFDDVDDNLLYLPRSAVRRPEVPLDLGGRGYQYGNWILWQFLTTRFGSGGTPDPTLVRRVWQLADGAEGGPDRYSIRALEQTVEGRGATLPRTIADFGVANLFRDAYGDVAYPVPPTAESFTVRRGGSTGSVALRLDHLTNAYVRFVPGSGTNGATKLRIALDLPSAAAGPQATVVTFLEDGGTRSRPVRLSSTGAGRVSVSFDGAEVERVVLVLTNASTRYRCWRGTPYACSGRPTDDGASFRFAATAG